MLLPTLGVTKQSREDGIKAIESKLFDARNAAFRLNASSSGRGYEFCNRSTQHVVGFRLGCVENKKGRLLILSERALENSDLEHATEKAISCNFWSGLHGFFPGEECKKGKLAIIQVRVADETEWKINQ
jgi:hypothetical protein